MRNTLGQLHYVIYGAGAIGGTIGVRLQQQGYLVTLIARGEHGQAIRKRGLTLIDAQTSVTLPVPTVEHPREIEIWDKEMVVLMCMKSQHTEAALVDLSQYAPLATPVVCVQNGVANEAITQRYFPNVYGTVVNLPAMHLEPGEVVTFAQGHDGILDIGAYPLGSDQLCEQFAHELSASGFSVRADQNIMRWKYAKLLMNLGNVMQAGFAPGVDFSGVVKEARREAHACYEAAGIDCADRDAVAARRDGLEIAQVPGVERVAGSSWQSLSRGTGNIETEYLNGEICLLGRRYHVPTPINERCVRMARALLAGTAQRSFTLDSFAEL